MEVLNLSRTYVSILPVLKAPWRDQLSLFRKTFVGEIFLLSLKGECGRDFEIVAISRDEIPPLRKHLAAQLGQGAEDVQVRQIDLAELCEEKDPRNGNVQEGLESDNFSNLILRLSHLKEITLDEVEEWIWEGDRAKAKEASR